MGSGVMLAFSALALGVLLWYARTTRRELDEVRAQRDHILSERNRLESYLELVGAMIVVLDPAGRIVRLNLAALEMLGVPLDSVIGKDWFDLFVKDEDRHEVRAGFEGLMGGGPRDKGYAEYDIRTPDGGERHTVWYRRRLRDEDGNVTGLLSAGIDVTERKRMEKALATLALQDELTGLYNRRGFRDIARRHAHLAGRTGRQAYIFYMDVDGLKAINDERGHRAGDRALQCVGDDLRRLFRTSDIVGRIGGDEFAALALVETDADLLALLDRVGSRRATDCDYCGDQFNLELSMGVARVEPDGLGAIDRALAQADHAMYAQKSERHDVVV